MHPPDSPFRQALIRHNLSNREILRHLIQVIAPAAVPGNFKHLIVPRIAPIRSYLEGKADTFVLAHKALEVIEKHAKPRYKVGIALSEEAEIDDLIRGDIYQGRRGFGGRPGKLQWHHEWNEMESLVNTSPVNLLQHDPTVAGRSPWPGIQNLEMVEDRAGSVGEPRDDAPAVMDG